MQFDIRHVASYLRRGRLNRYPGGRWQVTNSRDANPPLTTTAFLVVVDEYGSAWEPQIRCKGYPNGAGELPGADGGRDKMSL